MIELEDYLVLTAKRLEYMKKGRKGRKRMRKKRQHCPERGKSSKRGRR